LRREMTDEEWIQEALATMPPMSEATRNELALLLRAPDEEGSNPMIRARINLALVLALTFVAAASCGFPTNAIGGTSYI
jgi:hypothetical protein